MSTESWYYQYDTITRPEITKAGIRIWMKQEESLSPQTNWQGAKSKIMKFCASYNLTQKLI